MITNKKLSCVLRVSVLASGIVLAYLLYTNISAQQPIDDVFEQASHNTKSMCAKKANYTKATGTFMAWTRANYHTCIKDSNDAEFKAAAAKYILSELEKNNKHIDLSDLRESLEHQR